MPLMVTQGICSASPELKVALQLDAVDADAAMAGNVTVTANMKKTTACFIFASVRFNKDRIGKVPHTYQNVGVCQLIFHDQERLELIHSLSRIEGNDHNLLVCAYVLCFHHRDSCHTPSS
jgi:hypothetical protein